MTTVPITTPLEHRDAMLDVFTEISSDCALNDACPVTISLSRYITGDMAISVQLRTVQLVDLMADAYGLGPDCTTEGPAAGNYTRRGRLDIDGHRVEVGFYTARPKDRVTLIREWVAANYSDESKRLVTEGAEALPEDQEKFAAADAAGKFTPEVTA